MLTIAGGIVLGVIALYVLAYLCAIPVVIQDAFKKPSGDKRD